MAIVQSPAVPQADPQGLKWWTLWDNTTDVTTAGGEVYTQISWDNTAGVHRTVLITMKDLSVVTADLPAGASGTHTLNKPQQQAWLGIQFLLA